MPRGRNQEKVYDCPTSVKFPRQDAEQLQLEAQARGLSVSGAIREAVHCWINHWKNERGSQRIENR